MTDRARSRHRQDEQTLSRGASARTDLHLEAESSADAGPEGNVPDFDAIYEAYFEFVWSTARRLGVATEAMDDVVQEIFMLIHSKIGTLRQPGSLRSWIYGIVRRRASEHRRSQRASRASSEGLALHPDLSRASPSTPLDVAELSDRAKMLFALLDEIEWWQREVFVLAELDEMTAPEIAEALQVPLNTVYSRLRTARIAFEAARKAYEQREKKA